jgi:putative ABC transport system substrate-binding protein
MGRREFVSLLGGAVAAWPLAIRAQVSTRKPLIGILSAVTRVHNIPLDALIQGLQELGYVEGRSADFAFRFAEGKLDRLSALVEELVRLTPDVIVVRPLSPPEH